MNQSIPNTHKLYSFGGRVFSVKVYGITMS